MKKFEGFFKGVNLYGWLSGFAENKDYHFKNAIVESDIERFSKNGFDHVRVPVDFFLFEDEDGEPKRIGYAYLKTCLNWCIKYNLNMLISMDNSLGYKVDPITGDVLYDDLFYNAQLLDRYKNVWSKIAAMFSDFPYRVAFEPLSDAYAKIDYDKWADCAVGILEVIRQTATDNYVLVGGIDCEDVSQIEKLDTPTDNRIVYSFHSAEIREYVGAKANDIQDLPARFIFPAIKAATQVDVPLYCGEYGVAEYNHTSYMQVLSDDVMGAFELYKVGHCLWNFHRKLDIPQERVLPDMEVRLEEHRRMLEMEDAVLMGRY